MIPENRTTAIPTGTLWYCLVDVVTKGQYHASPNYAAVVVAQDRWAQEGIAATIVPWRDGASEPDTCI